MVQKRNKYILDQAGCDDHDDHDESEEDNDEYMGTDEEILESNDDGSDDEQEMHERVLRSGKVTQKLRHKKMRKVAEDVAESSDNEDAAEMGQDTTTATGESSVAAQAALGLGRSASQNENEADENHPEPDPEQANTDATFSLNRLRRIPNRSEFFKLSLVSFSNDIWTLYNETKLTEFPIGG